MAGTHAETLCRIPVPRVNFRHTMSSPAEDLREDASAKRANVREGKITRAAVAQLIGVTRSTVRRLELAGELHPVVDSAGVHWFDTAEVAKVAVARRTRATATSPADELAARAFELFAEATPLRDIVLQLRISPERVLALYEQWRRLGQRRELWITLEHQQALVRILTGFTTPAELVEAVRALAAERDYFEKWWNMTTNADALAAERDEFEKWSEEVSNASPPSATTKSSA
jgi:hypothetical protein